MEGGCGKKFCDMHKHTKKVKTASKHGTKTQKYECCANCAVDMEKDYKANRVCCVICSFATCLVCFMLISMIGGTAVFFLQDE